MIKLITITNPNGEELTINLDDIEPESGLFITEIEGLGPVKADINMTELAAKDGSKYNSSRANGRNIVMKVRFIYASSIEEVRLLSYKYFPLKKRIKFHIETDNRIAEVEGYIESNEPDIFSQEETASISIVCESAWFKDASENGIQVIDFSDIVSLFEFEFEDDDNESPTIEFSSLEIRRENVITYNGDTDNGFIMRMFIGGSVTNPSIYNIETLESIKIDTAKVATIVGSAVKAGDEIRINSIQNEKSVTLIRDGRSYNILNALDINAAWFVLHPGDNLFGYTADSGELNIMFRIESQILLQGV